MPENNVIYVSHEVVSELFGNFDDNIKKIENEHNVVLVNRGDYIKVMGEGTSVSAALAALKALLNMIAGGQQINGHTVRYVIDMITEGNEEQLTGLQDGNICLTSTGKAIRAKTVGQKSYVEAIMNNTVVFGVGPAGTGKTYLAVAMAVRAFKAHLVRKIILTRPAVEAGERLGFLPGDLQEKVDPYLRPLYDALFDMFGADTFKRYFEKGIIEVAPLAYMRGRTLDEAFIILDEAQNTTSEQMKMFLTRLGNESRMVITGDITQVDLPDAKKSGLVNALEILDGIEDIYIHKFTEKDVVRHKLVQSIIKAYESRQN